MDENKTFSLSLSPQTMLTIVLALLPIIGGSAYLVITKYNQVDSVINDFDPAKIQELEIKMKAQEDRIVSLQDSMIRIQEKSSDALALGREALATAKGNSNEINAGITSMNEQMKALRKATINPLGN